MELDQYREVVKKLDDAELVELFLDLSWRKKITQGEEHEIYSDAVARVEAIIFCKGLSKRYR